MIEEKLEKNRLEREAAAQVEMEHRKSIIADRLRSQLGEQRFAVLQEAIGRAPGLSPAQSELIP